MKTNFLTLFFLLISQALVTDQNVTCAEDDIIPDARYKAIALKMYCKIDYINSTNTLSQSYYRKERKKTDRKYLLTHFDFTTI